MGVDTSYWTDVGVPVEFEELAKPFQRVEEAVMRYEDRFDPKTGKKAEPKAITVKPRRVWYEFQGETYDRYDLPDAIAKHLGCEAIRHQDQVCGGWDTVVFGFGTGAGNEYEPAQCSLEQAASELDRLKALQIRLLEMGVQAKHPAIVFAMNVS
jgi:hypothetical protein